MTRAAKVKGHNSPQANDKLSDKAYKDAVDDLSTKTSIRPTDFDDKAIKILDYLEENGGRSVEACEKLAKDLKDISREHVSNWKAYVYTFLRKFDSSAYEAMKVAEGKDPNKTRRSRGGGGDDIAKEKKDVLKPFQFNTQAVEFVPGASWTPAPPATAA
eukprot:TRINITY_DN116617_c0_g1_i1.p1 TRINITY_DN116617_c0_g1~~TRINITY_DN116617_c0_g1_i1.p1  ORF type:complete len:159 (+),score=44.65 TRINITY_DN116617_c0_g1_i1:69-545(+)